MGDARQDSKVKRWARVLLEWTRAQLLFGAKRSREEWEDFQSHSIYFRLKALVVVVYGVIVFATIVWAPPRSLARNQIGATILVLEGDIVVGRYFIVENGSRSHWQNVRFEIDGGYVVERDLVRAGEKVTLYVKDFKRTEVRTRRGKEIPKRVPAPVDLPITALTVHTSEGVATAMVAPLEAARSRAAAPVQ